VDRLSGANSAANPTTTLRAREALVELQHVQHTAAQLEQMVSGHLERLAAAASHPAAGDGLEDERAFFQVWRDQFLRWVLRVLMHLYIYKAQPL
jgi:hypothetical protein